MGITDDIASDWHASYAALVWQIEMGADEVMLDQPMDRFALAEAEAVKAVAVKAAAEVPGPLPALRKADAPRLDPVKVDAVEAARHLAERASDLAGLRDAIAGFAHCDLRQGARNTVFSDGHPAARVMVIGEAPGRDEDIEGRPFVGRAGQLLDKMFAAIGLSRDAEDPQDGLYITNVMPWRPPGNRDPSPGEIAMMLPFLARHVALAAPDVIVVMGNTPAFAVLGQRGITRLRGQWAEAFGRPVLPMLHPAYLLRAPAAKREAWADLLALRARLEG